MDKPCIATEEAVNIIRSWYFSDSDMERQTKREILREAQELKRQRKLLELEKDEFSRNKAIEEKRLEQQKNLFDAKWKMLEEEWRKLATEQEKLKLRRQFYSQLEKFDKKQSRDNVICVSEFFCGVKTASSLKKRYKDLIKIFHPDNLSGDTVVIQKINQEYEELKKSMAG